MNRAVFVKEYQSRSFHDKTSRELEKTSMELEKTSRSLEKTSTELEKTSMELEKTTREHLIVVLLAMVAMFFGLMFNNTRCV